MKIIEGLKAIKELKRKADDLRSKIAKHSAYKSTESAVYGSKEDQRKQVKEWLQAHFDLMKEIERLTLAVHKTNLETEVEISIGGKIVKKSIAAWILRRKELANYELAAWRGLTDRQITEGYESTSAGEKVEVKIIRCYDPKEKDVQVGIFSEEPMIINSRLEVVNAITDLVE